MNRVVRNFLLSLGVVGAIWAGVGAYNSYRVITFLDSITVRLTANNKKLNDANTALSNLNSELSGTNKSLSNISDVIMEARVNDWVKTTDELLGVYINIERGDYNQAKKDLAEYMKGYTNSIERYVNSNPTGSDTQSRALILIHQQKRDLEKYLNSH